MQFEKNVLAYWKKKIYSGFLCKKNTMRNAVAGRRRHRSWTASIYRVTLKTSAPIGPYASASGPVSGIAPI